MSKILFPLFFLALSLGSATAQTISAADQKGIDETYAAVAVVFEKMDASLLSPWLAENAEQIIPTGEIVRGRANVTANMAGYMAFLKTQPKADSEETKLVNRQLRYLATGLVLTTYTEEATKHFGGKAQTEKTTYALVFRNTNGKWLTELIAITPVVAN